MVRECFTRVRGEVELENALLFNVGSKLAEIAFFGPRRNKFFVEDFLGDDEIPGER